MRLEMKKRIGIVIVWVNAVSNVGDSQGGMRHPKGAEVLQTLWGDHVLVGPMVTDRNMVG